jgi:hypothetical protein
MSQQNVRDTNFRLQWYVPQRVLYSVVQGPLNEDDSLYADEMLTQSLNQASDTVHLLIDVTRVRHPSSALLNLQHHIFRHMNIGWIATVGAAQNPILNFGISAISPAIRIRHRDLPSVHEAISFLQEADATLPDLTNYQDRIVS